MVDIKDVKKYGCALFYLGNGKSKVLPNTSHWVAKARLLR